VVLDFGIPLLIFSALFLFIRYTNTDLVLSDLFYSSDGGWFLKRKQPWDLMYRFGGVPGLLLGAGALFCAVFGARLKGTACARKMALHFVLALVVGQGLAVGALKSAWKRPRPKEIRHYGGVERFLRVGEVGTSRRHRSFPSSHATIAYYLITPFFVLRRTRRGWAVCSLVVGILYGTLMGVGRLAYGGHFASDIVGSAALTYLTGLVLVYALRLDQARVETARS